MDTFKRLLFLQEELQSTREKIDLAFKEYESAPDDSGEKYTAEIAVMKLGQKAQRLKREIKNLERAKKIS